MQGIEHQVRPPGGAVGAMPDPVVERPVWKRSHLVWFLIALSLVPGVVAATLREEWAAVPGGVRMTAYVVSGILIVVSCTLMLREDPGAPAARADGHTSGDSP
jgi:hypothetical protein